MAKLEEVQKALSALKTFLSPAIPFVNSHLNSFFMDSLWEHQLSAPLRQDLDSLSVTELKQRIKDLASAKPHNNSLPTLDLNIHFSHSSFDDIVNQIGKLMLASMNMSVKLEEFKLSSRERTEDDLSKNNNNQVVTRDSDSETIEVVASSSLESTTSSTWSSWKFDPFMSPKKMHEVEVMSEFVAKVASLQSVRSVGKKDHLDDQSSSLHEAAAVEAGRRWHEGSGIDYLIDLGSGKGYLSSFLTLLFDFNVLALDSSSINTYGCTKRTATLQKNWSSFLRRAQERRHNKQQDDNNSSSEGISKRGKHWKSKSSGGSSSGTTTTATSLHKKDVAMIDTPVLDEIKKAKHDDDENMKDGNTLMEAVATPESSERIDKNNSRDNNTKTTTTTTCSPSSDDKLKTVTLFVKEDLDLLQLLRDNFLIDDDEMTTCPSYGLIGLHTCGQLGVDSVKLFCYSKQVEFLVNVPCCYHLLNEEYHKNEADFAARPYIPSFEEATPGFPLCSVLRAESFYLGRNARMMSAQSLHRMSREEEDDLNIPRPLLYRAMLQVLIRQKLGHTGLEKSVGRLGSKFTDFHHYVRKAWAKLQLEHVPVSDEEIETLLKTCGPESERFHKYFLVRALFAPLIEGCILLDRLAYLLEQGDVHEAFIVELFDPFLSPRCHALVAVR